MFDKPATAGDIIVHLPAPVAQLLSGAVGGVQTNAMVTFAPTMPGGSVMQERVDVLAASTR